MEAVQKCADVLALCGQPDLSTHTGSAGILSGRIFNCWLDFTQGSVKTEWHVGWRQRPRSARTSLSKIVEGDVRVDINEFRLVPIWEVARSLGEPDHNVVGVSFTLTGELEGRLSLLLERPGVLSLMDLLLKRPAGATNRGQI